MRSFSKVVFNEFVFSATPVYTSVQDVEEFGGRQLSIMAVCTHSASTVPLTIAIQHSGDGVNFLPKRPGAPEITATLNAGSTVLTGGESPPRVYINNSFLDLGNPQPSLRYVRLAVSVSVGSVRVKLTLCVRGSARREEAAQPVRAAQAPVGSLARHEVMMREVQDLARQGAGLPPVRRAAFLVNNLSKESRTHLEAVDRHLASLPRDVQHDIRHQTVTMVQRALAHAARHKGHDKGAPQHECCSPTEVPGAPMDKGDCGCG